jgi:hypothetical protein
MNQRTSLLSIGLSIAFVGLLVIPGLGTQLMPHSTAAAVSQSQTATTLAQPTSSATWAVTVTAFNTKDMGANQPFLYNALKQTGKYEPSHLKVLFGANTTKQNILGDIDWLATHAGLSDTVVFSVNSHGYSTQGVSGIVPIDYQTAGLISVQELDQHLDKIKAKSIFLLIDCCFAGNFVKGTPARNAAGLLSQGLEGTNRIVLMSTLRGGLGIGINTKDASGHDQYLSFTRYVAEAVTKHYDPNKDGIVSGEEAYQYARHAWLPLALYYTLSARWQKETRQETGHIALPIPKLYDAVPGDFPLA